MPKSKQAARPADPDKLVRQEPGRYRTADDRFEVRDAGTGWFLVDTEQTNDFGQELMQGPFATLAAVRAAIPSARSAKVTPIRPPRRARSRPRDADTQEAQPPPSWLDRLPPAESTRARHLIAALERRGLRDPEATVRRDLEADVPAVAHELIAAQLEEIVAELPERGRDGARELLRRACEVLTVDGMAARDGLPGWMLVEIGRDAEPPNRRITVRELSAP